MEKRNLNIIAQNPGGTAGKGSYGFKISLPSAWVYELGLSPEDRACEVEYDGESITIRKRKKEVDTEPQK